MRANPTNFQGTILLRLVIYCIAIQFTVMIFTFHYSTGKKDDGISDEVLLEIAENLGGSNEKLLKLGFCLGFKRQRRISDFLLGNRLGDEVTSRGTLQMLCSWKERTAPAKQREELQNALSEAGLTGSDKDNPGDGMNSRNYNQ